VTRRSPLTEQAVRRIKLPPDRPFLWDSAVPGLGVRLYASGRHVYIFQYRTRRNQQRRMSGAVFGTTSLNSARKWAAELHDAVRCGRDPAADQRTERERQLDGDASLYSIEAVVADFIKYRLEARNRAPKYIKDCQRTFDRFVLSAWKGRDVRDIRRIEVATLVRRITDQLGPTPAANRAHEAIVVLFSWCVREGKIEQSPALGIGRPAEEKERDRVLSDKEIASVFQAAGFLRYPWGPYFQLLLSMPCREREVSRMRWEDIDLATGLWNLRASETKAKRATVVPLSSVALETLRRCGPESSGYIFSSNRSSPITGFSHAKRLIDARLGDAVAHWRIHDLRRSIATGLAERVGTLPHVIAALLNHAPRRIHGITALYNRAEYREEKREALEAWALHVLAAVERYPLPLTAAELRRESILAAHKDEIPDSAEAALRPLLALLTGN
jgi:integrase